MIAANASRSSTHGSVQFRPRPSHVASASVARKRGLPKFSKPRSISSSRRTLPPRLPKKWPRMPVSPKGHCSSTFQAWSSSRKIERSREKWAGQRPRTNPRTNQLAQGEKLRNFAERVKAKFMMSRTLFLPDPRTHFLQMDDPHDRSPEGAFGAPSPAGDFQDFVTDYLSPRRRFQIHPSAPS